MYILNLTLLIILILIQIKWSFGFSKNLLLPQNERKFPTFLIDFELASVLCQHSNNPKDLHLHDISVGLYGQDDESFPHCRHLQCIGGSETNKDCSGKGACIFDGFTTRCFCNEGYYGLNCEFFGNKNEEKEAFDEFGLEFGKVLLNNKYPNERKNWLKMKEIINEAKEANKKQKEFGLLIGKGRMEMVGGGGHETSAATSKSEANTETTNFEAKLLSTSEASLILNLEATSASRFEASTRGYDSEAISAATSASSFETSPRGYNTEASSILNLEATSSSSETSPRGYNTEAGPLSTFEANSEATSIKNSETNTRAYTEASLEASSAANTEANKLAIFEATASSSEASTREYNTEATSILNPESTPTSNSILYTEAFTEATSLKNSEASSILNPEASIKASRETTSLSNTKATSLKTTGTTSNFKPKSEANTEATISLNTQINSLKHSTTTLTVKESKSNKPNNEAILVDNEANFRSNIEAASTPNKEENLLAKTEAASLTTIPTGIKEASTKTEYASTKKFSTNEANLSKQMKQNFPTSEAPNTEAPITEASSLLSSIANSETNKVFASEAHLTSEAPTTKNPNYASSLSSTSKINTEANLLTDFEAKSTMQPTRGLKMMTDNTEANYEGSTTIKSVATTRETDNKEEIYLRTTMANVSPNSLIEVEATSGLKLETASEANFSSVETTSLASIETTSNNEAKNVSSIETSSEAGVEAKTILSIEASSKANIEAEPEAGIEAKPVAGIQASSRLGIEASSKGSIEASPEVSIEVKPIANSEASSKGSIEATSIKSEVKDTKTSLKENFLPSITATPLSNIEASSLASKFESNFVSTVKPSFSNSETTVPSASNSRLNSNKLNTEATSESEAKAKSPFEAEAETKFPLKAEAKTKFPLEAEAKPKSSSKAEAKTKLPFEAEAEMKSSNFEASTKPLFKSSTSEAESPSKTDSLGNSSTEATSTTNNIKPEASKSFTPQISSLNTRRNFETNFASTNTFSYTEASQISNSETISATTLFSHTEATEPLISVSEADAYINNEATSKTKTEASSSIISVNSASSFKEATLIPKTEAGSTAFNLASSASSFNEATSTKPKSTTEANSIKNITDTSNRTSFKLINVSEASTMFPFETEIKLRFKPGARAKFFSKSEASTKFPSESEARMKSSKSSTESASTIESVAPTKFPSEPETKMKPDSRFEASTKFPLESEAETKSHSEAEAETKSPSEAEANVKTPESEAKMSSFSEPETLTSESEASTLSFKFEALTKFPSEAEASTKFSTKPLASTNIFKNIEVNTTKATRKPSTRSKEISFEIFLNKIGARKLSTEKPKLSSENSEANLLKTTPSEAVTEANNTANLINNEAASTNIIKTEAETNENIETNTEPTLEAKYLVSNFEAKSEANTRSTYPIKSEATSEIYSKNVETITEAPLSLANTTNFGANVAATASDSVTNREFERATPLAGIEATIVANIVATSKPVASVEATSIASNQATSTVASNGAVSVARIEATPVLGEATSNPVASIESTPVANNERTPEASIKASPVASNEATSLAKVNSTLASNNVATITNTESTLLNSRTNVVSTSPVSLKPTFASLDKNAKENIEANSVAFATAKFVAENTEAANDATTSSSASSSFTGNIKQINSTLEANLKANKVETKTEATSLNTEASFVASTFVANNEASTTASTNIKTEANFNGTTSVTESSEANFTFSSGFISKATESSIASNVYASRFKTNSEATAIAALKTTLKTPRRFTKLQNCLQNWTRTTQNIGNASKTIKPIVEASTPSASKNNINVSVEDSTVPLSSKNIRVVSPQNHTISPTTQNNEKASSTIKLPIVEASSPNVSLNKTTVSVQDSTVPLPTKNVSPQSVVSPQNNTISPLKISSLVSTNFGFNCSKFFVFIFFKFFFILRNLQHYCGQQAFSEISLNASSNSLKNLECFNNIDGKCGSRCENGYFLNSNGSCEDVDECKTGVAVCGKEAFCRNLEGAYRCECPKILKEDGHECAALSPKSIKEYIKGRVIVNGSQAENPKCFKDMTRAILQFDSLVCISVLLFGSSEDEGFCNNNNNNNNSSNFLIPANECKLIEKGIKINTLSTRLLIKPIIELKSFNYLYILPIYFIQIQCHFTEEEKNLANFSKNFTKINKMTTKMEITKTPKMTSQKVLEDVFDKKMMRGMTKRPLKEKMETNTEQIKIKNLTNLKSKTSRELIGTTTKNNLAEEGPICLLDVTDKNGVHVLKIKAGETLTLTLRLVSRLWQQKIRNITIFPKRCYAINLDNGGRYCLTDNGGCAFEKGLFPEWKRKNNFKAEANFSAFRWTETNTVRFECDCSVCSEEKCPKFDCEKRRNFRFKKYFYNNWALNENDESSVGNENLASLTWLSRPSSLPVIMEVEDENKRKRRRRKRQKV
ncbi:unnamed protein product [Meloidogyne enterolobii]|uniref:Uncharacterized protein n=1 Tax=Meloidogyne enterolobii TaxID=390850 RepID=A0ACB1AJY1_MELEN